MMKKIFYTLMLTVMFLFTFTSLINADEENPNIKRIDITDTIYGELDEEGVFTIKGHGEMPTQKYMSYASGTYMTKQWYSIIDLSNFVNENDIKHIIFRADEEGIVLPSVCREIFATDPFGLNLNSYFPIYNQMPLISFTIDEESNVDGSNVEDAFLMFGYQAYIKTIDLSGLKNFSPTNMDYMFAECRSLTTVNLPEDVDTSNCRYFDQMFYNCSKLRNIDLTLIDTSSAINLEYMFCNCSQLPKNEIENINDWDMSNVSNFRYFLYNTKLEYFNPDFDSKADTINLWYSFGYSSIKELDLSCFSGAKISYFIEDFNNCCNKVKVNASDLDFSQCKEIYFNGMPSEINFENCDFSNLKKFTTTLNSTSEKIILPQKTSDYCSMVLSPSDLTYYAYDKNDNYLGIKTTELISAENGAYYLTRVLPKEEYILLNIIVTPAGNHDKIVKYKNQELDLSQVSVIVQYENKYFSDYQVDYHGGKKITDYDYKIDGDKLIVSYTENGITKSKSVDILLLENGNLSSIKATKKNLKYSYFLPLGLGDVDYDDITVTAYYEDGTSKKVTGWTHSILGETITIKYTENGITKSTTIKLDCTYTSQLHSITATKKVTSYTNYEDIKYDDITVTAKLDKGTDWETKVVKDFDYKLIKSDNRIEISYSEGGITKKTYINLTIKNNVIYNLVIKKDKTVYNKNEKIDLNDVSVYLTSLVNNKWDTRKLSKSEYELKLLDGYEIQATWTEGSMTYFAHKWLTVIDNNSGTHITGIDVTLKDLSKVGSKNIDDYNIIGLYSNGEKVDLKSQKYFYTSNVKFNNYNGTTKLVELQYSDLGTLVSDVALPNKVTDPNVKKQLKLYIGSMDAYVDGVVGKLDVVPLIRNDRTMLPIRFIAENLGATVGWNASQPDIVTIKKDNTNIVITLGSNKAQVNGIDYYLDSVAFAENNRTYLPVRFISENLGAEVIWDAANPNEVIINAK